MAISGTIHPRSRLCDTRESERDNDLTQEQSGMALLFKTCAWCACIALDSIPITNNVIPSFYTRSIQNMFPPANPSGLESDSGKFWPARKVFRKREKAIRDVGVILPLETY